MTGFFSPLLTTTPAVRLTYRSVEALWCNRTLEFVRHLGSRANPGAAGNQGAAGSMRAIPVVNPGSMQSLAVTGSMRALTTLPASTGAGANGGGQSGAGTGTANPAAAATSAAAGGAGKVTFTRKAAAQAEANADIGGASLADVEVGVGAGGIHRKPSLVASYELRRSKSFADLEYADLLVIAAVNNTAAYDATDPKVIIGDASVSATGS